MRRNSTLLSFSFHRKLKNINSETLICLDESFVLNTAESWKRLEFNVKLVIKGEYVYLLDGIGGNELN